MSVLYFRPRAAVVSVHDANQTEVVTDNLGGEQIQLQVFKITPWIEGLDSDMFL